MNQKTETKLAVDHDDRLLTIREVADRLAVSTSTIHRMIGSGEIKSRRIRGAIRFTKADVDALIAEAEVGDEPTIGHGLSR